MLKNIINEAIVQLTDCSLNVVAIVCDALAANVAMAKLLGCRVHETSSSFFKISFPHPVEMTKEVSVVFDAAHGLKLLRNLLGDKFCKATNSVKLNGPTLRSCRTFKKLKAFEQPTSSEGPTLHLHVPPQPRSPGNVL